MRRQNFLDRFWNKANKDGPVPSHCPELGPCWVWTAHIDRLGYGWFQSARRKSELAHRVAWRITNGTILDGIKCCHKCDNRSCVNPDHLFLGTQADNMRDAANKKRMASGDRSGSRLHPESRPRGENTPCAKLRDEDIPVIRALVANGKSQRSVARRFGVHHGIIGGIIRRKAWKHVA